MIRLTLVLACLILLQQEDKISQLVRQLSHDDVEVRDRAAEELAAIGAPARGAVEKAAKNSDPEVAARARSILGEIELAENRAKVLGPAWRVTLPGGDHTLSEIVAIVKEQTSVQLKLPDGVADERVRIEARGMLLWQFLDSLCQTHGGLRVPLEHPEDAVALEAGKPSDAPSSTSGPFRVWIDRLRLERRGRPGQPWDRGSMVLGIMWQPNVRPLAEFHSHPQVRLGEVVGDDGKRLEVDPQMKSLHGAGFGNADLTRGYREFIPFEHPSPGVRRVTIRGHVDMLLPLKYESLKFEKPLEAAGQARKVGNYTIALRECKSTEKGVSAILRFQLPDKDTETLRHDRRIWFPVRFKAEEAVLVGQEGKESRGVSNGNSGDRSEAGEYLDFLVEFPSEASPKELRLRFLADYFERRVEFDFKDIELP